MCWRPRPLRKPFASFEHQLSHIKERCLVLPFDNTVRSFLKRKSHYRLSDYMYYFQVALSDRNQSFRDGVAWGQIVAAYETNTKETNIKLRAYLLNGLQLAKIATYSIPTHKDRSSLPI